MKDVTPEYIAKEEAAQRKPVELYHIWHDGGANWYYTSGDVPVNYNGADYVPAPIERDHTAYSSVLEVSTMKVRVAFIEEPAVEFIAMNPVEILWISIMKLFRDQDPLEADVVFLGQIKNVSFKGVTAEVVCVGFEHFLKKVVPRLRYINTCNHSLFDPGCGLTKNDYKIETSVTIYDATACSLTSDAFGGYADNYFIRGEVIFGSESRTIVDQNDLTVTMAYRMRELVSGNSVSVYPGCDGRIETCQDKFSNTDHFLGFPYIPLDNPARRIP